MLVTRIAVSRAIALLYGHPEFRESLLPENHTLKEIKVSWQADLEGFQVIRNNYLLY